MMNLKWLPPDDDVMRVEIVGAVTRDAWQGMGDPLAGTMGREIYARKVLLSLRQSMYLDSTGVEWLIQCHRKFKENGGRLILHSLVPATTQLLRMMRLDQILEIEATEASARSRIRQSTAGEAPPEEPIGQSKPGAISETTTTPTTPASANHQPADTDSSGTLS